MKVRRNSSINSRLGSVLVSWSFPFQNTPSIRSRWRQSHYELVGKKE